MTLTDRKYAVLLISVLLSAAALARTAAAEETAPNPGIRTGWQVIDGDRFFYTEDGTAASGEAVIDGQSYLFAPNGVQQLGWQTVSDYIASFHFSQVDASAYDVGYAIGGSTFVVSPVENAAAHAILMNGGCYIQPHTIKRIEYRNGTSEPIEPVYQKEQVLSSQSAYLAAQLEYGAIHGGVYNYLQILDRDYQTFGKTGTSDWGTEGLQYNIPTGSAKDTWMVGQTTQYTICTWVGYEKGVKDEGTYFSTAKQQLNTRGHIVSLILDACTASSGTPAAIP